MLKCTDHPHVGLLDVKVVVGGGKDVIFLVFLVLVGNDGAFAHSRK